MTSAYCVNFIYLEGMQILIERVQGGLLRRIRFAVTFSINEGPCHKLGDISFTSEIENLDFSALRSCAS